MKYALYIIIVLGSFSLGYWNGYSNTKTDTKIVTVKVYIEREKDYEKRVEKLQKLDDNQLIKRYCSSSVYDMSYDTCIKTVKVKR